MDIKDYIQLSGLLTCPPFLSSEEEGNTNAILIQKKLKEIAYYKALSLSTNLTQLNPIKFRDYDYDLPPLLTNGPWEKEYWHRNVEENYCYSDLAYFWEEAGEMRPFYLLGNIAIFSCCEIANLAERDIDLFLDEHKDWLLEFMDSEESLCALAENVKELSEEISRTERKGSSANNLINELVEEINFNHLNRMGSYTSICQNLSSYIMAFYTYGEYNVRITTVANSLLPHYLNNAYVIPDSREKQALDQAIEAFYSPLCYSLYGILPIVSQSSDWVTLTYICGGYEDGDFISEENMYPFWILVANIIDVLLPDILKKNHLM